MSNSRLRMAAVAGSLALSLSLLTAPAAMAQEAPPEAEPGSPQATIVALMAAIEAKDFEALPTFFCEEFAEQAGGLDFASMADEMPPGFDIDVLLDAFIFDVDIVSMDVVSQSDTEAIVQLEGSMAMDINTEALTPFIEALIEMSGMEADPETVEMFSGMMLAEFEGQAEDISEAITLVPGTDLAWLVCSELGADDEAVDPMSEDVAPSESAPAEGS
jgi:hypothetical protein